MVIGLGSKIARIRILADMTQVELAKVLGVTQISLSNWETNRTTPSWEAMEKLIDLGKKHKVLFTIEDIFSNKKSKKQTSGVVKSKSRRLGPRKQKIT
jgi:DNA-binding XRE family transcriptional regulator